MTQNMNGKKCKVNKNKITHKKQKEKGKSQLLTLRGQKGMEKNGYKYPIK